MRRFYIFLLLISMVSTLSSCFILGQVMYDEDDCRLYYIYSIDKYSGLKSLEWSEYHCGAGGGVIRMQWNSRYVKLEEKYPENRYVQEVFEYQSGANYHFDSERGYVLSDSPYGW